MKLKSLLVIAIVFAFTATARADEMTFWQGTLLQGLVPPSEQSEMTLFSHVSYSFNALASFPQYGADLYGPNVINSTSNLTITITSAPGFRLDAAFLFSAINPSAQLTAPDGYVFWVGGIATDLPVHTGNAWKYTLKPPTLGQFPSAGGGAVTLCDLGPVPEASSGILFLFGLVALAGAISYRSCRPF